MNNFLNEAVKASMPQANSTRIPLAYVHKKERDTFYEIQASDLPPVIRQNLNPRHKPKVRVTTDERTGEIMSYSHLAYQVDLTQVAKSDVSLSNVLCYPRK